MAILVRFFLLYCAGCLSLFYVLSQFIGSAEARSRAPKQRIASYEDIVRGVDCKNQKNCNKLVQHIYRDSNDCRVHPKDVERLPQYLRSYGKPLIVDGNISYLGFFPGNYRYSLRLGRNGTVEITAPIFFHSIDSKISTSGLRIFIAKLAHAELIWNLYNTYKFPVKFRFPLEERRRYSAISATLTEHDHSGPYMTQWTTGWTGNIVAHELGHVMGLDDEYANSLIFSGDKFKECDLRSIMCNPPGGAPLAHHYYVILRRAVCQLWQTPYSRQ